jgi:hypothetical protein
MPTWQRRHANAARDAVIGPLAQSGIGRCVAPGLQPGLQSAEYHRAGQSRPYRPLTTGGRIIAVNSSSYSGELIRNVVRAARGSTSPIELIVKTGDNFRVVSIDYQGALRYPHLERDPTQPARLDDILTARP